MSSDMSAPCDEHEIRQALSRVLASEGFVRSHRLQALLQYLVEESLAGRGDKIKATTIAIEVHGRDENFDQQADPIVRVEAGRLRQRLAEYYQAVGDADAVLIEIPKGGYRPVFSKRQSPGPAREHKAQQGRQQYPVAFIAMLSLLVVATCVLLFALFAGGDKEPAAREPTPGSVNSKPYIVVMPVATASKDEPSARLAAGLVEALITNLSKVSGLSVMAHASVLESQHRQQPYSIQDYRSEFGVTHLLRSTMERQEGDFLFYVQLVDAKNAQVLWADRLSHQLGRTQDLQETLAAAITTELAVQLQPEEKARLLQSHSASAEAWLFYRQGLITIMPPRDLARVQAARQLFDRALEVAPEFAGGYAGHSFSHSTRALFMNSDDPEGELRRARALAEQAIAQDPEFGAGYAMLAFAQVLGGDSQAALSSVGAALAIQPGDAFSRFVMGMSLVLSGRPAEAIPHLQEAIRLDPVESRMPYLNVLGIAHFGVADYGRSLGIMQDNYERGGPKGPHMDVFIAAAMTLLGDEDGAKVVADRILQGYPDFPLSAWLERWVTDPRQLSQTIAVLQPLGLLSH